MLQGLNEKLEIHFLVSLERVLKPLIDANLHIKLASFDMSK